MISLNSAGKSYKTPASTFTALQPIDLAISKGEFVAITGPSGSGKSTLLNLVGGIDVPSSGDVVVAEQSIANLNESRLAAFRGKHIGIVFQFFQLIPTLTALENVVLAMDLVNGIPRKSRKSRAGELLDSVGLFDHRDKLPATLSGGEQQRVAIARALANDPPILLADEPTGNLDSKNSELVNEIFADCARDSRTILVATHETGGLQQYSRHIQLADGALVADEQLQGAAS